MMIIFWYFKKGNLIIEIRVSRYLQVEQNFLTKKQEPIDKTLAWWKILLWGQQVYGNPSKRGKESAS